MSIHTFLQERLETDDTTKLAKVFDPTSMTRCLEISTKQEFLETYRDYSVQKLVEDAMPDLNVGLVMNGQIVKHFCLVLLTSIATALLNL